jgi:hypothetical protein
MDALLSLGRLLGAGGGLVLDRALPHRRAALPFALSDLSAGWLTRALAPVAPGVRVRGVECLDQHSGTTTRARIALDYADRGGTGLPDTLFVKIAPHAVLQRLFVACTGIGRNEVEFYRRVRSDIPVRAPGVHAAVCAGGGRRFVLLLEDLASGGARFPKVGDRATLEHGRQVIEELARLHARFWESSRFQGDLAWVPCLENRSRNMPWERFVTGRMLSIAVRRYAGDFPPVLTEVADLVIRHRDGLEGLWARGPRTLIHGDCHLGNLFFQGEQVGFLDWQLLARAPGMRDVSYFLCNSLPTELRREHERTLIGFYLERLEAQGVAAPDFADAWERHRLFAVYTWLAAAFTAAAGAGLQPREVGMAGLRRTTLAVADLESVACVRSELGGAAGGLPTR